MELHHSEDASPGASPRNLGIILMNPHVLMLFGIAGVVAIFAKDGADADGCLIDMDVRFCCWC